MNTSRLLPMALCTSALVLSALSGCSKEETPTAVQATPDAAVDPNIVRSDAYEGIRGEIVSMPVAGNPNSHMKIHHEHIPAFKTKTGVISINSKGVSGMRAMTMEFPSAEGLSLEGLAVGDKIAFTFVVNWGGQRAWEVTKIEKLAPDTEIDFSDKPNAEGVDMPIDVPADMDHSGHDHSGHDHDAP